MQKCCQVTSSQVDVCSIRDKPAESLYHIKVLKIWIYPQNPVMTNVLKTCIKNQTEVFTPLTELKHRVHHDLGWVSTSCIMGSACPDIFSLQMPPGSSERLESQFGLIGQVMKTYDHSQFGFDCGLFWISITPQHKIWCEYLFNKQALITFH